MQINKTIVLSLFTLASVAAQGQLTDESLNVKVDFSTVAVPAPRAIEALSQAAKIKLDVAPTIQGEFLTIYVKDTPLKDLMKRIAEVTTGEWRLEGETYRLFRATAVAQQQARNEQQARVNAIRKEMNDLFKSLEPRPANAKPEPDGVQEGPMGGMGMFGGGSSAANKAIIKLLRPIDPAVLASIGEGQRLVFSSNPTRIQRPLMGNLNQIISEMIAEHNKAIANQPKSDEPEDDDFKQVAEFLKQLGVDLEEKPIQGRAQKALLIAARQPFIGGLSIELKLYDVQGKVILSDQVMLSDGEGGMFDMAEIADMLPADTPGVRRPERPKVEGPDKPIEFSATTKEINEVFGGAGGMMMGGMPSFKPLSAETDAKMLRPDLYDPLSFELSESLLAAGAHKKMGVVANLPDDVMSLFGIMRGSQGRTVNGFLGQMLSNPNLKTTMADGWVTIVPAKPHASRTSRVDRVALSRLLQASKSKGVASLDDMAAYAQTNRPPTETGIAMLHFMLYAPNVMSQGMMGMQDWDMLRLYGQLSMEQKMGARNGISIPFANLAPGQRTLVERMVYGSNARFTEGPAKQEIGMMAMMRNFMPGQQNSWKQEPTEIMPNGLPAQGQLQLNLTETGVATVADKGTMASMFGALGPDELAMFQFMREDATMGAMAGMMPQIQKVKVGTRKNYRFTFLVAPEVRMEKSLNDDSVDKSAQEISIDNLPPAFKAQIQASLEAMKKSGFGNLFQIGRTSGGSVPPAP